MSSPVVFALTRAQAETLDLVSRPGFKPYNRYRELSTLTHRYLVQKRHGKYTLTAPGLAAQELVRMLALHKDGAGAG